ALLVPYMIERYGFYEGKGTSYRVEPRQVVEVFDFLKTKAGAAAPGGLAKSLTGSWKRGPDPWETLTFGADGKYRLTSKRDGGTRSHREERGAWKVTGKGELVLTPASVSFPSENDKGEANKSPPRRYKVNLKNGQLRLGDKGSPWKRGE